VWWYKPIIPALGKLRQEDLDFEANLGSTANPVSTTITEPGVEVCHWPLWMRPKMLLGISITQGSPTPDNHEASNATEVFDKAVGKLL
jgi:hypothetical protein